MKLTKRTWELVSVGHTGHAGASEIWFQKTRVNFYALTAPGGQGPFAFYALTAPGGQGPFAAEVPRPHKTTHCRVPLDKWSACRRDLYISTQATHKRQTSMHPAGFETAIPGIERPQTQALYRATTATGWMVSLVPVKPKKNCVSLTETVLKRKRILKARIQQSCYLPIDMA